MAISISVLILAIGLISLFTLPVEQYPDIAPNNQIIGISHIKARKASRRCFPIILHFLFIYWNSSSLLPAIILVNPIKVNTAHSRTQDSQ